MPEAAPSIRIGCAGLPRHTSRSRYFEGLAYLETTATFTDPPKASTLRRWRRETPEASGFGMQAWQLITHAPPPGGYPGLTRTLSADERARAGSFRDSDVVAHALEITRQACEALQAEVVLFRTPPELAPSAANRDRLRRFFGETAPAERFPTARRVWEPQGLWEPDTALELCAELGLLYACDPLANDPLGPGPEFYAQLPLDAAYFRITGLGRARRRLAEWDLEALAGIIEGYRRAWVVFGNVAMHADALRFSRLLAGEPLEAG